MINKTIERKLDNSTANGPLHDSNLQFSVYPRASYRNSPDSKLQPTIKYNQGYSSYYGLWLCTKLKLKAVAAKPRSDELKEQSHV